MSNTVASVERLKEQIGWLTEEQPEVLKAASYIGIPRMMRKNMTTGGATLVLTKDLERLEKES